MTILASQGGFVPGAIDVPGWQNALRQAIRDPAELCRLLDLDPGQLAMPSSALAHFPLLVPRGYAARIERGNPRDPLLLQVLPQAVEEQSSPAASDDPVGDRPATLVGGLIKKYHDRALLITTGACAVHCRYCFRREFPYAESSLSTRQQDEVLACLAAHAEIEEVILSGGDPLTWSDPRLARWVARLAEISHLKRLRIHTRLPIVIPERVVPELIDWLRGTRLATWLVVHANHPAEIDAAVAAALGRLVDAGVPVLNQAVLLAGVNDRAEVLAALCRRLVELRVIPYYLHQLDRVQGALHFEVPEATGRALLAELRSRLPGYAVPRYVREEAGAAHKQVLS